MLDTLIMFLKEFFEKVNFESQQRTTLFIGVARIKQVTYVRSKNSYIQGRSLYVIKVISIL